MVPIVPDEPAPLVWMGSLVKRDLARRRGSITSRWMPIPWPPTGKLRTGKSSRRAFAKPAPWLASRGGDGLCQLRRAIPFYIFYSIFGFQRVGDMIWAAGDAMARGFLLGGTSGRTTLNGEGLQHQDGHSQLLALTVPNLKAYDPAFAFELTVIIRDGIERMYGQGEDVFITSRSPIRIDAALPGLGTGEEGAVIDGVLRGLYAFEHRLPEAGASAPVANLLGSGAIMKEVRAAAEPFLRKGSP